MNIPLWNIGCAYIEAMRRYSYAFCFSNILVANKINIMKEMSAQVLHVNTFQKVVKGINVPVKRNLSCNNDSLNASIIPSFLDIM